MVYQMNSWEILSTSIANLSTVKDEKIVVAQLVEQSIITPFIRGSNTIIGKF